MRRLAILSVLAVTAACAAPQPTIVQTTTATDMVHLTQGFATQIELPDGERADNVAVGNDQIVRATAAGQVVNLAALAGSGETNVIVRAVGEDGRAHVHMYRLSVTAR